MIATYTKVREVMTRQPIMIDGLASVRAALEAMRRENVGSLVIDKRDEGDEYGVVVLSDIAEKAIACDRSPDRISVYEVMSKPVLTVEADMNIRYAVRMLQRFRLSLALVLDHGALVGVVTLRELIYAYYDQTEGEAPPSPS